MALEIETWIVDHNFFPAPINQRLLEALDNPLVVPELSRFNVELNCEPLPLEGDALDARGMTRCRRSGAIATTSPIVSTPIW